MIKKREGFSPPFAIGARVVGTPPLLLVLDALEALLDPLEALQDRFEGLGVSRSGRLGPGLNGVRWGDRRLRASRSERVLGVLLSLRLDSQLGTRGRELAGRDCPLSCLLLVQFGLLAPSALEALAHRGLEAIVGFFGVPLCRFPIHLVASGRLRGCSITVLVALTGLSVTMLPHLLFAALKLAPEVATDLASLGLEAISKLFKATLSQMVHGLLEVMQAPLGVLGMLP